MNNVVLALGSNLGDRNSYLNAAILAIVESGVLNKTCVSSVHETKAILKDNSPQEWNLNYLNMAIKGETFLKPYQLLETIKKIEDKIGRKSKEIWAPREIDIDILLYDDQIIQARDLKIPHPELLNRSFCLELLKEVYPQWKYPILGPYKNMTADEIISCCYR